MLRGALFVMLLLVHTTARADLIQGLAHTCIAPWYPSRLTPFGTGDYETTTFPQISMRTAH